MLGLLAIGGFAAGFSPLTVPLLEDQLWTTVKWTIVSTGEIPQSRSGQYNIAYDPPNKRYRQSSSTPTQGNRTMIADYKTMAGYMIFNGVCTKLAPPANPPAKPIMPDNAVDDGATTVSGGQPADLWTAQVVDQGGNAHSMSYAVATQPAAGRNPVRLLTNDTCPMLDPSGKQIGMETHASDQSTNLHVGPMPDWLFAVPANCTGSSDELPSFEWKQF
jgi:hypothetical protein